MRKDIQALRAIAVLSVLIYHLVPNRLPGGFVGVDVFFVISGFLITSHLIKDPPQRLRDVVRFWCRRMQRLLPAVVVVILAMLAATVVWLPRSQWLQQSMDALASMFYFENWRLISLSTDYLDATKVHSSFQHFWSLSVEEQYYIIWPFVVGGLAWWAARRAGAKAVWVYAVGFGALVLVSLVASISLTHSNPSVAYFSTWSRLWELGLGSLLAAVFPALSRRLQFRLGVRAGLFWVGLAGIVVSVFVIDANTPFPGWVALLPTVATGFVIVANDPVHVLNPRFLTHSLPVQFTGDVSYALYLWHWPLIVLTPAALGHELSRLDKLVVLVASFVVAWLSTRFVEQPVRANRLLRGQSRRVFIAGAVASSLVAVTALGMSQAVAQSQDQVRQTVAAAVGGSQDRCLGAAALDPTHLCPRSSTLITSPEFAKSDVSKGIRDCLNWPPFATLAVCTRGDPRSASSRIALMGNSHAGHWLPALEALATKDHWQVDTYVAAMCLPFTAPLPFSQAINGVSAADLTPMCTAFNQQILDKVKAGPYDLVIMSAMDLAVPAYTRNYEATIRALTDAGKKVLVIRDTPAPMDTKNETPDCVAKHSADLAACSGPPSSWIRQDPLAQAADDLASPQVKLVGVNQYICEPTVCPPVIGGVIVYSDFNHMTATFAASLAPYLEPAIRSMLSAPRTEPSRERRVRRPPDWFARAG